nr:unnamed protein product [Spirometra erinaceieuropaei]
MRQARERQSESLALSDSNPDKSVANIFRHRSSSKRGHELPPMLNDNKVFLTDDTDKAELFSAFFAKHLATESDPSHKFMLVLASNQPEQFDWAINDRMDELVYFDLPKEQERERMIRHYFDLFILQPSMDKRQRIKLADGIDYTAKCVGVAKRTPGLSGRELSKIAVAWQTAAYSSEDGTLTEAMMDTIVDNAVAANAKKRAWRQHRLPDQGSP